MPSQDYFKTQKKAQVCLDFVVVGASIAGLATAFALREAGHNVLVLEKSDGKARSTGGLRSPPNMTKILNQWGLGPALSGISHKCTSFRMRNGCSGDFVGVMKMTESFLRHLVADFLFLQHGDLHSLLYDLAREAGANFMFNAEVVDSSLDHANVTLKTGDILQADVVIAADGYDSTMRLRVTGEEDELEEERLEQNVYLTFEVPADRLQADESLASLTDPFAWSLWLGNGYLLNGNLLPNGNNFTVSLVYKYDSPLREGDEEWRPRSLDYFHFDPSKFEPRLQKILKLAENVSGKVFRTRPPVDTLVCDKSRTVLVGEAGHPLLPSGHHNTALVIEDAQTLGLLFCGIRNRGQIPQLLNAFEEIRQPRVSETHAYEVRRQTMSMVPSGPSMVQRDKMMRNAMAYEDWEHMDEDTFKMVWGSELSLVGHDAAEKVADWWTQWGSYFEKKGKSDRPANIRISISRDDRHLVKV